MTEPSKIDQLRTLLKAKRDAARQKVLDERYGEALQFTETEDQRHKRIMEDPSAWTTC
ncbi:MAG TPA: hypothetical protein VMY37_38410 [Thermoguttaceae bacterium]|nr:hypothetical protein [Thermoguttaceae bacterium]